MNIVIKIMEHPYLNKFDIDKESIESFNESIGIEKGDNGQTKICFRFLNSDNSELKCSIDFTGKYYYDNNNRDAVLIQTNEAKNNIDTVYIYIDPIAALVSRCILNLYNSNEIAIAVIPKVFSNAHVEHLKNMFPKAKFFQDFVDHAENFNKTTKTISASLELEAFFRGHINRFEINPIDEKQILIVDTKKDKEVLHDITDTKNASLARYFFNDNYTKTPKQVPKRNRCRKNGYYNNEVEQEKYYS